MDNSGPPRHYLLDLAEQYYVVAKDIEQNAHKQLIIAAQLNMAADKYCEQASRETKHD